MAETSGQRFDQHTDDIITATTKLMNELADREGQYVWKKYSGTIPHTVYGVSNNGTTWVFKVNSTEIDLSQHIFEHSIKKVDEKTFVLNVTVSAGNTFNIKPQLLTDGLKSVCPSFNPVLSLPCRKKFIFE